MREAARACVRRNTTRGSDDYRSRPAITCDVAMSVAGYQNVGLANGAAHYCAATIGIGDREAEWTGRYPTVRSVTRIWRCAARSGDVDRGRATKTQDGIMTLSGAQRGWLTDRAAHYCAATIGIGHRETERTSRYPTVCSVTRIWRCATRGSNVYSSRPTMTQDGVMTLAGTQRRWLANGAADYSAATVGIGYCETERTSRYARVRSVTRIRRSTARGSDVHRSRPTKTQDRVMSLTGT